MPGFLRSRWFWIIVVLVALVLGGGLVLKSQAQAKKKAMEAAAASAPVSPYAAIGNGKADVEGGIIQVAARRSGIVKEVYVQEGDQVVKGQILARQEDDDARLALAAAKAAMAQAQAQIRILEVKLAAARREYQRLQGLQASNFVARQKLDQQLDVIHDTEAQIAAQKAAIQTAQAQVNEAQYALDLTVIRAPANGRIARRYANPGAGASTLNVSNMFDLEPDTARIVRAEIVEADLPNVSIGQQVEIQPESDPSKAYVGRVLRRAAVFGARKLASDDPTQRSDERVVEVVVSADNAPFLIGQRVLVKFMKPGYQAGVKRDAPKPPAKK